MTGTETAATGTEPYSGVLGAFPYAFRATGSRLCRAYVVTGGILTALVTVGFALALVNLLGTLAGTPAGILTFQPALYLLAWLASVAPLTAPILLVARRHRRGGSTARYDAGLAVSGFLAICLLYLALVVSVPPALQRPTDSALVRFLYALPQLAGFVPPLVAAAVEAGAHYLLR